MTAQEYHWCESRYPGRCFGMLLSCGHSFSCAADPAIDKHRCAASYSTALWSLLMAACAFVIVWSMVHHR